MKIDTRKEDGLMFVTVTVPRYNKNNPGPDETSEKIKIGLNYIRRKLPSVAGLSLKQNVTLDNRTETSATWVFELAEPEPASTVSEKQETTTRRRRTRKTTKKTETEV